jgi:hypothetical protein
MRMHHRTLSYDAWKATTKGFNDATKTTSETKKKEMH